MVRTDPATWGLLERHAARDRMRARGAGRAFAHDGDTGEHIRRQRDIRRADRGSPARAVRRKVAIEVVAGAHELDPARCGVAAARADARDRGARGAAVAELRL